MSEWLSNYHPEAKLVFSVRAVFFLFFHLRSLPCSWNADNKKNKQVICAMRLNFIQKFHRAGHTGIWLLSQPSRDWRIVSLRLCHCLSIRDCTKGGHIEESGLILQRDNYSSHFFSMSLGSQFSCWADS